MKSQVSKRIPARRSLLAQIHVAKKQLGLDEETYRSLLVQVTGLRSAGDCDEAGLRRVVVYLKEQGFRPRPGSRFVKRSSRPYVRKIYKLWWLAADAGVVAQPVSEPVWGTPGRGTQDRRAALRGFVKRQCGVDDPEFLTPDQAHCVIEAIKAMTARASR